MAPPTLARLRATLRLLRVGGHLSIGALIVVGLALWRVLGGSARTNPAIVCWWYRHLRPMLSLEVRVQGQIAQRALLVSNHISWLDIPVLGSLAPMTFLSKSEVRQWPMIGWMSAQVGTLFIKRGGHQTSELIERIAARVLEQQPVVIFPEGTTSNGLKLRRFHPRLLAAAQQPHIDVQPVAIRYGSNAEPDPIAPFIDDDTLIAHLWRVLCQPKTEVEVRFLELVVTAGTDRRALAANCELRIAQALGLSVIAGPTTSQRRRVEERRA
ncbi:lysophospholipid acyltransferase family protein [Halochromatium sp.]